MRGRSQRIRALFQPQDACASQDPGRDVLSEHRICVRLAEFELPERAV
jgi:hypothetical protein